METVTSHDGTAIAYQRGGSGPPLVLVHGTGGAHTRWAPILPTLEQHFTVYAIDRCGRGGSGDHADYAFDREFEDVAAVVDSIAQPVNLLGHSSGAILALEATRLTRNVQRLVLYEPPLPIAGVDLYPDGIIDRLFGLLTAGEREAVLTTFLQEVVQMPPHELEIIQTSPVWPARVAAAHTLPQELREHERYHFVESNFSDMGVPTLLLLGGDSPPFFSATVQILDQTLPNSRIVVLPGQQHIAIDTAPDMFTREVLSFLQ